MDFFERYNRIHFLSFFLVGISQLFLSCISPDYTIDNVDKPQKIYVDQHLKEYEAINIGVMVRSDVDGKGFITIDDTYNQEPTIIGGKKFYKPLHDTIWLEAGEMTSYWSRDWYIDTLSFDYKPLTIKKGTVKIYWQFNHSWWPDDSKNVISVYK